MKTSSNGHALLLGLLIVANVSCGGEAVEVAPTQPAARSCEGLSETCGANPTSCCDSPVVEGGSFKRFQDAEWPATISPFRLGRFEVSVGRMRAFVADYPASLPVAGEGAHPRVPGTGWQEAWTAEMPVSRNDLDEILATCPNDTQTPGRETWTSQESGHEDAPITCVTWYLAVAFCIWDGGRLPTDAEWNYAVAGGAEQREFPWGNEQPTVGRGHLWLQGEPEPDTFQPVGSYPDGAARWGHLDMMGSRLELTFDVAGTMESQGNWAAPKECSDCAVFEGNLESPRAIRDINYLAQDKDGEFPSVSSGRRIVPPWLDANYTGFRCAYDLAE